MKNSLEVGMKYSFDDLEKAPLVVDAIYESGKAKNISAEPLHKLLPKCGNMGGFRKVMRADGKDIANVVLYTSMEELEWPDYFDTESGIFRYYGDNRKPGNGLTETK